MTAGSRAWAGVAAVLAALALLSWPVQTEALDWQPALAFNQPWRAFTAVGVHYSVLHLVANLAAVALAGVFGVVARVPPRMAVAWLAAWPLTQLGLLAKPSLLHYGGLSGVVHAGVAVVIVSVLVDGTRAQRWVGCAVSIGFCAKLLSEAPWREALRHPATWDIAVAPVAHTTGAIAGVVCALLAIGVSPTARQRRTRRST